MFQEELVLRQPAISNMELCATIVKCPAINCSTRSSMLDVAGTLHSSIVHVQQIPQEVVSLCIVAMCHSK